MTELLNTLYVQTPGSSLHLENDTLRVVHPDQPGRKILPLARIDHLVLFGGVTITDDLLLRCADDRRSISWLTGFGRFRARVCGPTAGNPLLRRSQHRAHDDEAWRLSIAQRMVAGKIHNSRQVLLRAARDASGAKQSTLRAAAERNAVALTQTGQADDISVLMGTEGMAARDYFAALPAMCPSAATPFQRTRRPPADPVNCLLSFLYGMLRVAVHGALEQAGLDPYIGFLHGVRPGKPALALDLMEEFRPLLADRLVMTMLNRKELSEGDFERLPGDVVRLTDNARRTVLNAWQTSRQRTWPHAHLQREVPAALLPLIQARLLARHLRGDLDEYLPWTVN
ncbi:type I-C CRISPR-associated endonuclease Cas1c [Streptosporangium sp. NBC_01755]|uniref:type I-C CRISPR-associated endonuclease Cas1c n=1 Tax=unclassified Streptosporangium TaxID=2632669 RepID=UPI002DDAA7FD|nr:MULTISPECIES: type I-C CRISPR-associated endonuclease Cas1c [unclassified Streptosporangium]WSA24229.1 type I-C CRISPR-associated endonuclease Cas1c [Streptosporangium sp. NBC_01810]WSC97695.1 type I-C CRISPR-associated endonuclease Cas1c [Streptosporangium sp. NBC_01755]